MAQHQTDHQDVQRYPVDVVHGAANMLWHNAALHHTNRRKVGATAELKDQEGYEAHLDPRIAPVAKCSNEKCYDAQAEDNSKLYGRLRATTANSGP